MKLARTAAILALVILLPAMSARADDLAEAKEHYKKGTTAFELGAYDEAVAEYAAAYRLHDDPAILYNLAQANRLGGHPIEAIRQYRMYLIKMPDSPSRAEIEQHIADLQRQIASQPKPTPPMPAAATPPRPPEATPPSPQPQNGVATLIATSPPPPRKPIYRRWWLWTTVGVAVAAGIGVGLALGLTPNDAAIPQTANGNVAVTFH